MAETMTPLLAISVIIALLIGTVAGYGIASGMEDGEDDVDDCPTDDGHGHVTEVPHDHGGMAHMMYNITDNESEPGVSVIIHDDPKSGWNVEVNVTNFTFAPRNASTVHVFGEGHAHLYIDGVKITRLYSPWYFIPELVNGSHQVRVTLNTNSHADYAINGTVVEATASVLVVNA